MARSRFDVITELDRKILKMLSRQEEGLQAYQISNRLNKHSTIIYRALKRLQKLDFVEKLDKSPAIWRLNLNAETELIILIVECPKCKNRDTVDGSQSTKKCSNCKNRYWVTNPRIRNWKKIKLK